MLEDYEDGDVERLASKLFISRIMKKRGIKVNLSISMPQDMKTDFLLACSYNDDDYKDVIMDAVKAYMKEKGLDVLVARKMAMVEHDQLELEEIKQIYQEKGSARLKVSTKYINERILSLIRIPLARGEWSYKESVDVADVESVVKDSVKKFGITWEDACNVIKMRADKMEAGELQRSINVAIYELLTRKPGEGLRPRDQAKPMGAAAAAGVIPGEQRVTFGRKVDA